MEIICNITLNSDKSAMYLRFFLFRGGSYLSYDKRKIDHQDPKNDGEGSQDLQGNLRQGLSKEKTCAKQDCQQSVEENDIFT